MIEDWNRLITFLTDVPQMAQTHEGETCLVLAGNCLPYLADEAAKAYLEQKVDRLFLVGGKGHATQRLRENFSKQGVVFSDELSEAMMYHEYLSKKYSLPASAFLLEDQSTNSGENAQFALDICRVAYSNLPARLVLMNDPLLQKRTDATFRKVWQNESLTIANYVPKRPKLVFFDGSPLFTDPVFDDAWTPEYFTSLVLGELNRLIDTPEGYGPRGAGYIGHVDVPEDVLTAFHRLKKTINWKNKR